MGQLLALARADRAAATAVSDEQLEAWGWRIPFVIGALCALVALYLRRGMQETESFAAARRRRRRSDAAACARCCAIRASADRARPDRGRHARVLHLHDLHAEVPGQHRRLRRKADATLITGGDAVRVHAAAAAGRRAVGPHRPPPVLIAFGVLGTLLHGADPDRARAARADRWTRVLRWCWPRWSSSAATPRSTRW